MTPGELTALCARLDVLRAENLALDARIAARVREIAAIRAQIAALVSPGREGGGEVQDAQQEHGDP